MNTQTWHSFIDWVVDHAILISAFASLLLTILACVVKISFKSLVYAIAGTSVLTVFFSFEFYKYQLHFLGILFLPLMGTIALLCSPDINIKHKGSIVLFIIHALLLLFASELSKSNSNTWGSGLAFSGVFMIVHLLPLFQITRLSYTQDNIYGKIKLSTGFLLLTIVLFFGFKQSEYNGATVELIRNSILFLGATLLIEGIIMISTNRSN
jgi:hypothetical protein